MTTFNRCDLPKITTPHRLDGTEFSEKLSAVMSAVQNKRGYSCGLWVTKTQANLLGGFTTDVVKLKNGNERRPTANNSQKLLSGVKPDELGIIHKFFIKAYDPITKKPYSIPKSVLYYNVEQCYGVNNAQVPLIMKWNAKKRAA